VACGGWTDQRADQFLRFVKTAFDGKLDVAAFRG
jgi:hypothetical protein